MIEILILSLDPSTKCTGWSVFYLEDEGMTFIDSGCITPKRTIKPIEKCLTIVDEIKKLMKEYTPKLVLIEEPFVTTKNSYILVKLTGIIEAVIVGSSIECKEIHPNTVKSFYNTRDKKEVRKEVLKYFSTTNCYYYPDEELNTSILDISDSIALAIYYYENYTKKKK